METVNLNFRYLESDYTQAMRAHYASRLRLPLDIAAMVGAAVLGAYELRSGYTGIGAALISLSAVFAILLIAAFTIIPTIAFRREPKFRDDYSLTFSPQGIHFRTAHIDSDLQWEMYTRALVDSRSFVLYYGSQQFTVVPKRVFQSPGEQETFERLLRQKIPIVTDRTK